VVGDDVEDHPESGVAQPPKRILYAELRREPRRIDDVIAVGRIGPCLHGGSEVEVADPELAKVGHELAGTVEVEVRK
jgi:hypothetical protein